MTDNFCPQVRQKRYGLVHDWHWIVNHAWSFWLCVLAFLFSVAEAALPYILVAPEQPPTSCRPRHGMRDRSLLSSCASLRSERSAATMASYKKAATWLTVCATFVGGFEGFALKAYPDRLAHNLPTVCYGETEGVKLGDHYTKEQCTEMLANKLPRYWNEIAPSIKVKVSDNEKIAYTSFAYNVGSGAFKKSTMLRRLNAGDHKGACDALLRTITPAASRSVGSPGVAKPNAKSV
jgi:lysozyme